MSAGLGFYIDADERVDDDLILELKNINLSQTKFEAFECRRKNHFNRRWMKVAGQYPDYICRLYNKTKTDFSPLQTHARIETKNLSRLQGHLIHYTADDLGDMIGKMNKYSDWQSNTIVQSGKRVSALAPFSHGLMAFIKFYILRFGFMAGLPGLNISILNAMGSYLKYAKAIEKQNEN